MASQVSTDNFQSNYLVEYTDTDGIVHKVPYIQSWYARAEATKMMRKGYKTQVLAWDKDKGTHVFSQVETDKARNKLPKTNGLPVTQEAYERLAQLEVIVVALKKQARKGAIVSDDYDSMRQVVNIVDGLVNYTPDETDEEDE